MQSKYYRFLNFPGCCDFAQLEAELTPDLVPNENNHWRKSHWGYKTPVIFDSFHKWLWDTFGCELANIEVFYTAPHGVLPWHTDNNPPTEFVKINYIWGDINGSRMLFGEINTDKELVTTSTPVGTPYVSFKRDEVSFRESVLIRKPILANIGKPHAVVNHSPTGRWCLCIVPMFNGKRILFPDAVNIFSECAVN